MASKDCPGCGRVLAIPELLPAQVCCHFCGTATWICEEERVRPGTSSRPVVTSPALGILDSVQARKSVASTQPLPNGCLLTSSKKSAHQFLVWAGLIFSGLLFLSLGAMLLIICLRPPAVVQTKASLTTQQPPESALTVPMDIPASAPKDVEQDVTAKLTDGTPVLAAVKVDPAPAGSAFMDHKVGNPPVLALKPAHDGHPGVDPDRVDRAVAAGIAFLKKAGDFPGYVAGGRALAGLTLLACGVPADDPAVLRCAETVRTRAPGVGNTYELALCVLFLDHLHAARDSQLIRGMALRLIAAQGVMGGWGYTCAALSSQEEAELLELLKNPRQSVAVKPKVLPRQAKPGQAKPGAPKPKLPFRKPARFGKAPPEGQRVLKDLPVFQFQHGQRLSFHNGAPHEDNSLTQFAILALWSAQKQDIPAERPLAMAEARFRASQGPDGSWCYTWRETDRCKYSMTCAGLLGLAAGRGSRAHEGRKDADTRNDDPAIEKALRFIGQEIGTDRIERWLKSKAGTYNDTKSGWGGLYFLWSIERAAVVYDLRTIGGKDWYAWGAPIILDAQKPDGGWQDTFPGIPDTCFALLFLKRTNVVQDLTQRLRFLTMSKDVGDRLRESEPVEDLSYRRRAEPSGPLTPARARGLKDD